MCQINHRPSVSIIMNFPSPVSLSEDSVVNAITRPEGSAVMPIPGKSLLFNSFSMYSIAISDGKEKRTDLYNLLQLQSNQTGANETKLIEEPVQEYI